MQTRRDTLANQHAVVHFKIRSEAICRNKLQPQFDSVEEFCDRLNRLQSKSDRELSDMGLERSEIGAHVLDALLN